MTMSNRSRFAYVRVDDRHSPDALYDIVDNKEGSAEVLAQRVKIKPAREIVGALNNREDQRRFFDLG